MDFKNYTLAGPPEYANKITFWDDKDAGVTIWSTMFDVPDEDREEVGLLVFSEPTDEVKAMPRKRIPETYKTLGSTQKLVNTQFAKTRKFECESGVSLKFDDGTEFVIVASAGVFHLTVRAEFVDGTFDPECEEYGREPFS